MVIQTVTSPAEARLAAEAGADALAVQASAAGGHSGTLTPQVIPAPVPLPDRCVAEPRQVSLPVQPRAYRDDRLQQAAHPVSGA
jgi:NAD(P)H-dependent flavin oxidoreductase YrpB (nitropropane dioxygenase family)